MATTIEPMRDEVSPQIELPPESAFVLGERVTGLGVIGEVIDRPGPYSVTVIQNGARLSASGTGLETA